MADVKVTDVDRDWASDFCARLVDGHHGRVATVVLSKRIAEVRAEGFAAGAAQERERWAAIVQQETGYQAGVAAERERCAKVVENRAGADAYADDNRPCGPCCTLNAAAIRAGEVRG